MAKINWSKLDKTWLILTLIVLGIGFFLRLAWLGEYPLGFHSQEALLGYRGKLLSTNLIDETGRKLPLIFTSFEGYQLPLPSYLVAFSVKIFGFNELAVHLPFALFSCLGLISFFFVCRYLFPKNKWLAVWAVLVLALSPGLIFLSRTSSYSLLLLNLILLFLWLFLFLKKRKAFKTIGVLAIIVFLMIVFMVFGYWRAIGWQQDLLHKRLGFFTNPAIINSINQMRGEDLQAGNPLLGKLFYNKSFYLIQLIKVFFDHLKPQFYFLVGDDNPSHGLTNFGPFLAVFLPLFLVGVWCLFVKKELKKTKWWLIIWFLLGILPSLFTYPSPDQEKLVLILPVLAILIGFVASRMKKVYLFLFAFFLIINSGFVFFDAFFKEPIRAQKDWQYGTRQLVIQLQPKLEMFDKIFITDKYSPDLGPQLLFYLNYPIDKLWQETNLTKGQLSYRQWINQIGKITIGQKDSWQINPGEIGLLIITPEEKDLLQYHLIGPNGKPTSKSCYKITEEIQGLDGEPIYLLAEGISQDCLLNLKEGK